jgi:hypothetical protein
MQSNICPGASPEKRVRFSEVAIAGAISGTKQGKGRRSAENSADEILLSTPVTERAVTLFPENSSHYFPL